MKSWTLKFLSLKREREREHHNEQYISLGFCVQLQALM